MGLKTQQGIVIYSPTLLNGEKLQALIQNINPDYITIYIPIGNITIKKGTSVFINFWDETATYEFQSVTLSDMNIEEHYINITKPVTLTKIFHRAHPRITLNSACAMYDFEGINRIHGVLVDLSAGGAQVLAKKGRKEGMGVKLAFAFPNGEMMEDVGGKIMWVKDKDKFLTYYGIQFDLISEIRRKKIIAYINEELAKQHQE